MAGNLVCEAHAAAWAMSAVVTLLAMVVLQPVALRVGWMDHPRGRKDHGVATPVCGGLGIFAGIAVSTGFLLRHQPIPTAYLVGAGLLLAVGLLDDLQDLRWWYRVLAQIVAGLVMVYLGDGGPRVEHIPGFFTGQPLALGAFSAPFTVFATVGLINAVNMCDGVDGLAGSQVLLALCAVAALGWDAGNEILASRALIVVSAITVFMFFNMRFPWQSRARLFLGNGGSAMLGYTLAWFLYRLTQNPAYPVNPVVAPWLIAIPLIDCLALMTRRASKGHSPFHADRDHLHHLLLDAGFAADRVTLLLFAASLGIALLAILALAAQAPPLVMVWVFVVMTLAYAAFSMRRERAVSTFAMLRSRLHALRGRVAVQPDEAIRDREP